MHASASSPTAATASGRARFDGRLAHRLAPALAAPPAARARAAARAARSSDRERRSGRSAADHRSHAVQRRTAASRVAAARSVGARRSATNHDAVSSSVHAGVKVLAVIVGLAAALAVAGAAPATTPVPGQLGALKAIRVALAAGRIDGATANAGRAEIARAAHLVRTLPSGRREHVAVALEELAAFSGRLTDTARARADRAAAGERRLLREALRTGTEDRHHRRRRPRLPLLPRTLPRVPSARELRRAERARRRERRGGSAAARRRADRARRVPAGRRDRLGVLLRLLGRARAVALGHGTGGCRAGVRAHGGARSRRGDRADARGTRRVPRDPRAPAHERPRRPVDPPLLVPVAARAQRPTAGGRLAAVVRDDCRGPRRGRARCADAACRGGDTAELRHRLLDVLLAPARAVAARLPAVRRAAAEEARAERPALRRRGDQDRGLPASAARLPARERVTRHAALLALEAGDRAGEHRRRPDEAARARRRLAHARVGASRSTRASTRCTSPPTDWASNHASFDALPIVRATAAGTAPPHARPQPRRRQGRRTRRSPSAPRSTIRRRARHCRSSAFSSPGSASPGRPVPTAPDPSVGAALQRLPAGARQRARADRRRRSRSTTRAARALAQYAATLAQQTPGLQSLVLAPAPTTGDRERLRGSRSIRSAPPCRRCCRTSRSAFGSTARSHRRRRWLRSGALTPDVVAFHPAPAAGKGLWTTAELPQLDRIARGRDRNRAADPARRAAGAERGADLVARLRRAGRRRAARPAEPGHSRGRRGGGLRAARRARLPGRRGAGGGDRPRPIRRSPPRPSRCSSAATSTASTSSRSTAPDGRPVVARRGALRGGAAPATIALPAAKLGAGPYRVGVRLVASVNPGPDDHAREPAARRLALASAARCGCPTPRRRRTARRDRPRRASR